MGAAQVGQLSVLGLQTGRTYQLSIYGPDATGSKFGISGTTIAGSTSDTQWFAPEGCVIKDFAIHTGQTSTATVVLINGSPYQYGAVLTNAVFLDSLNNRPKLNVPLAAGQWLSLLTA